MTLLHHALIKPHFLYAILIWGSTCSTEKKSSKNITKQCCSSNCWLPQTTEQHISPAYSKLGILKLDDLYKSEIANFMFNYSNSTLPKSVQSLFIQSIDVHSHFTRSNSNINFYFPSFKTSRLQQSFKYQGVKIWNKISPTLKYQSYSSFKEQFTNLLVDQY